MSSLAVGLRGKRPYRALEVPLKALLHLMRRNLSKGWNGFYAKYEEAQRKKASMKRGLSHMLNRDLSRGWLAWVEMVEERAEFLRLLRRGMSFMMNTKIALGFGGWQHAVMLSHNQNQKAVAMTRALSLLH